MSFMIIAIHIYPFAVISMDLDYIITRIIFRICVPFFLMTTGYYLLPKALDNKKTLIKYTIKILKLYVLSISLYLPINLYNGYFESFSIITFIKDLFIEGTFYHLWYFPSLIIGIWLTYFFLKNIDEKFVSIILAILFIIGLLGDSYYKIAMQVGIIKSLLDFVFCIFDYTRNGIFYVPIFLYLGYVISKKTQGFTVKHVVFLIVSLIMMVLEGYLLYSFNTPKHNSMYIFLIPVSFFLFMLMSNNHYSNKKVRNIGTSIYIIHPLVIVIVRFLFKFLHFDYLISNNMIMFLAVSFISLMCSWCLEKIKGVMEYEK